MSVVIAAMTGIRAVSARQEVSTETLAKLPARPPVSRSEAAPPIKPAATPLPKVYRAARANLYGLAKTAGGDAAIAYRQITPGYFQVHDSESDDTKITPATSGSDRLEQVRAAISYRSSQSLRNTPSPSRRIVIDVLV